MESHKRHHGSLRFRIRTQTFPHNFATADIRLTDLNEDCLWRIFQELNLREQYALLTLHSKFAGIVRRLWHFEYARTIDIAAQFRCLSVLPSTDLERIFTILCSTTKELRNIDALPQRLLTKLNETTTTATFIFEHIQRISYGRRNATTPLRHLELRFPQLQSLTLVEQNEVSLPALATLPQRLRQLRLVRCTFTAAQSKQTNHGQFGWKAIFRRLRLDMFEFIAARNSLPCKEITQTIANCSTLRELKLSGNCGRASKLAAIVVALPQLQQLTIHVVKTVDNHCTLPTEVVMHLKQRNFGSRISAIRLKCYFNSQLLSQCVLLPRLRTLAWHTQLNVEYITERNIIQWQAQDPRTARCLLEYIEKCRQPLMELDLRGNCHATPEFIFKIQEKHRKRFNGLSYDEWKAMELRLLTDKGADCDDSMWQNNSNGYCDGDGDGDAYFTLEFEN